MQERFSGSVKVRYLRREPVIEALRAIAQKLIDEDPRVEKVVLFGSLVTGRQTPRSDADICVILREEDQRRPMDRIPEFLGFFLKTPVPVDLLVYTRDEVEERLREGNRFLAEIVEKGMTLAKAKRTSTAL